MTEPIEPQFDITTQEARELARRATLPAMPGPAPDQPDPEVAQEVAPEVAPDPQPLADEPEVPQAP